jgi:outer membrane PBP1 activator LpoA protein
LTNLTKPVRGRLEQLEVTLPRVSNLAFFPLSKSYLNPHPAMRTTTKDIVSESQELIRPRRSVPDPQLLHKIDKVWLLLSTNRASKVLMTNAEETKISEAASVCPRVTRLIG